MTDKKFNGKIQLLSKDFPAVQVEHIDKNSLCIMAEGLCMVEKGTLITELPDNYKIIGMDKQEVEPTGKFFICVESIDPYYLVIDLPMNLIES